MHNDRSQTPELVRAFFEAAAAAVQTLAAEPGFRYQSALHAFTRSGMTPVTPEEAAGWVFWAEAKFRTSRIVGEITYGDRELFINMVVGPNRSEADAPHYGLWEWAAAFGMPDERANGDQLVLSTERVRSLVAGLGEVFARIWPRIAHAAPDVFRSMDDARAKVRQADADAEARRTHERIVSQAAEAFHSRDYRRVVRLLESVENRLTPAERAKLKLARKYLTEHRRAT